MHLHESNYPIHVNMRTGTVMSLTNTATGKVFAALLPPKKIESLLHEDFLRLGAVPTLSHTEKFEQSLREVRQRGVARAVGDPIPGINGLSAPVFDSNGNVVLVITAIGAAGVFDALEQPAGRGHQALRRCGVGRAGLAERGRARDAAILKRKGRA